MKTDIKSVKEVFDDYRIITVPYYQRNYVWGTGNGKINLHKFINDIFSQYKADPNSEYFIGTLAFCSDQTNDVIDGQQRLTSLILILSLLAEDYCSQTIKNNHKNLLFPTDNKFIIQEEIYLTDELKHSLLHIENPNSQQHDDCISKTIEYIKSQIGLSWKGYSIEWYDGLYNYILEKVKLMRFEFNNNGDALKYFININTFSVPLTQSEVFFSILSQAIKISGIDLKISDIKRKVKDIAIYDDIKRYSFKSYEKYGESGIDYEKGIDNIIYIFLNSYIESNNNYIDDIGKTGIGRWISCYKSEIYNDVDSAKDFVENFYQYLHDFEFIYKNFKNIDNVVENVKSSLYLSSVFLKYCKECIVPVIAIIFKFRHLYYDDQKNLYKKGTNEIDLDELNEIAKRLNLIISKNFIYCDMNIKTDILEEKRIVGFKKAIEKINNNYAISISNIKDDIYWRNIFTLKYYNKPNYIKRNIIDDNCVIDQTNNLKEIKFIMCLQESYLEMIANPNKDFNDYARNLLNIDTNITIEHLYTIDDYNNDDRFNRWCAKNVFRKLEDFNNIRIKFENLSLLIGSDNSSAGSKTIREKLNKYKTLNNDCKYLIQSLVDGSDYYNNQNIQALGLPERKIKNIDQNTWELSENNRDFNIELLKLAIDEIANK